MKPPELLSPAGTLKHMRYAYAYGADAIYAGQPRYSLRARNNEFNTEKLAEGIDYAHNLGKKFFVASNVIPHDNKVKTYMRDMEPIIDLGPDALIMADPGLIMMVRERWPDTIIHLSVQANTTNSAGVKFWQSVGVSRVILSRELSLKEIGIIREECPDMELEVFIHGALCIAYSGRCLLSGYFKHRDPNQGACTNSCRWKYGIESAAETPDGDIVSTEPPVSDLDGCSSPSSTEPELTESDLKDPRSEDVYLIEEEGRPGEKMPVFEDEHGTYIMNSKDLRAVQHVKQLTEMGIDSLKIEGRTKSHFYAARTAQIYRQAINDAVSGKEFNKELMVALDGLASRGYTEGFYRRHVPEEYQNYTQGISRSDKQRFVGEITGQEDNQVIVDIKNKLRVGDTVELMSPNGNKRFTLEQMNDKNGNSIDVAPGSGHVVRIPLDIENSDYGLLVADIEEKPHQSDSR